MYFQWNRRNFLEFCSLAALILPHRVLGEEAIQEAPPPFPKSARGSSVAATVHPLATDAAIQAMQQGGTAIDAIVSAALTLSVVDGHNSGIGGGCFLLIRSRDGKIVAIDGRETAPMAATRDMFVRNGKPDTKLSQTGPLACGIPGEIAALEKAHKMFGKLPWAQLCQPAIEAAEGGYEVGTATARALQEELPQLRQFSSSTAALLNPSGNPWTKGERLRQLDLAKTLRAIATGGCEWFYRGEFADICSRYLKESGGIATREDFARYAARERQPIQTPYRGHTIVGFPPPSSGGIHVAQMLMMLERFPLRELYQADPVKFYHVIAESMKLAFADRAFWLGDSDFAKVPLGLIDPDYIKKLSAKIDLEKVSAVVAHGVPPRSDALFFDDRKHTTHLTAADSQGNWVAMTATVNTTWGNKMVVPGTGVVLNNEMDDFSVAPGTANAFGLIGAEANAVAGGKRPLSSMSPTIVLDAEKRPLLTCGAAGGPKIINTALQVILRCIDLGQSIDEAIAASRIHHQWSPDTLAYESSLPQEVVQKLAERGHAVKSYRNLAISQGIQRGRGDLVSASDPRVDSKAAALESQPPAAVR